jgi:hypothetical protein
MDMRIDRVLCLGVVLFISQHALAKLPFADEGFGGLESTVDFCSQADAKSAAKYQQKKQALLKNLPEKEVAAARTSQDYRRGYDSMTTRLRVLPNDEALGMCRAFLEETK